MQKGLVIKKLPKNYNKESKDGLFIWATWGLEPHINIQSLYIDALLLVNATMPRSE